MLDHCQHARCADLVKVGGRDVEPERRERVVQSYGGTLVFQL